MGGFKLEKRWTYLLAFVMLLALACLWRVTPPKRTESQHTREEVSQVDQSVGRTNEARAVGDQLSHKSVSSDKNQSQRKKHYQFNCACGNCKAREKSAQDSPAKTLVSYDLKSFPAGSFKKHLEQLTPAARKVAMATLKEYQVPVEQFDQLRVEKDGSIYFICSSDDELRALESEMAISEAEESPYEPITGNYDPVSIDNPPALHSRPGSQNVIYLDFNGGVIANTNWNSTKGVSSWDCYAYDKDGDPTTFSSSEQNTIVDVWKRMSEDFAPFDVDVTTEPPASITSRTVRVMITDSIDKNGLELPHHGIGGVAGLGSFGDSYRSLVWAQDYNAALTAECASHEVGHTFGLSHDGQYKVDENGEIIVNENGYKQIEAYYGGHTTAPYSWGPLMGTGYNRKVSQWSKGDYYMANNTQDDLAMIADKLTCLDDDHQDTLATASALKIEQDKFTTTGVIERTGDEDMFVLSCGTGPLNVQLSTVYVSSYWGGNLDAVLELRDSSGTLITSDNPVSATNASISYDIPTGGLYYLTVKPTEVGDPMSSNTSGFVLYGSLGQYKLDGTLTAGQNVAPVATSFQHQMLKNVQLSVTAGEGIVSTARDVNGDELTINIQQQPQNGSVTIETDGSYTYTPTNDFTGTDSFTYKLSDGSLESNLATVSIEVIAEQFPLDANFPDGWYKPSSVSSGWSVYKEGSEGLYSLKSDAASSAVEVAGNYQSGTLTLKVKQDSGDLKVYVDDMTTPVQTIAATNSWTTVTQNLTAGTHRIRFENSGNAYCLIDEVQLPDVDGSIVEIFPKDGVLPSGNWSVGNWKVDATSSSEGLYSLSSPEISGGSSTYIEYTGDFESGTIEYSLKIDGNTGFPAVFLYVDNMSTYATWHGKNDWKTFTRNVSAGRHTIRWVFKDHYGRANSQTKAWIDNVKLPVVETTDQHTVTFDLDGKGTRTGGGALTQQVADGEAAVAPTVVGSAGWNFTGWDSSFTNVTSDQTVTAQYTAVQYAVTFDLDGKGTRTGGGELSQSITHNASATAPVVTANDGWIHSGWSGSFDQVTSNLNITALYTQVNIAGSGSGSIRRQLWNGISGSTVTDLTGNADYPLNPDSDTEITSLSTPSAGDNYGQRIYGYLHAPVDGAYTFWIAGDDGCELNISTDRDPANKVKLASVSGWTSQNQWNKYASQQSVAVTLEAGESYYIEVLHKEGGGGDHVAVAWQFPGMSRKVIAGEYLSPYVNSYTVTFELDGKGSRTGGGELSQTVTEGSAATAPTVQAGAGWAFTGWDKTFSAVTSNMTVKANYSAVNYSVSATAGDGGDVTPASQTVSHGGNSAEITATAVSGYHFTNWSGDSTASTNPLVLANVTSAKSVTANFAINTYTVTFDVGTGTRTGGGAVSQQVDHGSAAVEPTVQAADGWKFTGWDKEFTSITGDMTVTAQYQVTNEVPVANVDFYQTEQGQSLTVSAPGILANDYDPEDSFLDIIIVDQPQNGVLTMSKGGGFSYVPNMGFSGTDTFTYKVSDGQLESSVVAVTITVNFQPPVDVINFNDYTIKGYGGSQDAGGTAVVEDGGTTLHLTGNTWKYIDFNYQVTPNTVIEFDFWSPVMGEDHGIGLDTDTHYDDNRFKLYGVQAVGVINDFNNYANSAPGVKHYVIPYGQYFTGEKAYLYFVNDHDGGSKNGESFFRNVKIYENTDGLINFNNYTIKGYGGSQDAGGTAVVEDNGATLHLTGNTWKYIDFNYTVTPNTVIEFDFRSPVQGEEHCIGLDINTSLDYNRFKLYGTQSTSSIKDYNNYTQTAPDTRHYVIPYGQYFTGDRAYLFFSNDHDGGSKNGESYFSNVKIYESTASAVAGIAPVTVGEQGGNQVISYNLEIGWNLISLPVAVNQGLEALFVNDQSVNLISGSPWRWDATTQRYVELDGECPAGQGVWVYSAVTDKTVPLDISAASAPDLQLKTGWNLIGVAEEKVLSASHSGMPTIWVWYKGQYHPIDEAFEGYKDGHFYPGLGYWIFSNTDQQLPLEDPVVEKE